jgi:hypothetical protein
MRRLAVLVTFGAALTAFGAFACGSGNDKPPLTPDTERPVEGGDAAAPAPSAAPTTPAN